MIARGDRALVVNRVDARPLQVKFNQRTHGLKTGFAVVDIRATIPSDTNTNGSATSNSTAANATTTAAS